MNDLVKQIIEEKFKLIKPQNFSKKPIEEQSTEPGDKTFQVMGFKPDREKFKKTFNTWDEVKKFAIALHKKHGNDILVIILSIDDKPKDSLVYRYNNEKNIWYTSTGFKRTEMEVDEIVDEDGNIARGDRPPDFNVRGITQKSTTDKVVKTGTGQMGNTFGFGFAGGRSGSAKTLRYWAEADMSKSLGYKDTLGKDEDIEDAEEHFEDELGLDPDEAKDRMEKMGYDKSLPEDKVRLVEDPRKFVQDYLESILPKKSKTKDVLEKDTDESVLKKTSKNLNPIIKRQILSLLKTSKENGVTKDILIKYLEKNE